MDSVLSVEPVSTIIISSAILIILFIHFSINFSSFFIMIQIDNDVLKSQSSFDKKLS